MPGYDHIPLRELTEAEFAMIGRIMLVWGSHEQDVGTIVSVGFKVPRDATPSLVHALGYSKKVDLAREALLASKNSVLEHLAKELDYVKRTFRPERDTLAHGSFGLWSDDAWVRSLSKDRFVVFDDFYALWDRANYARDISMKATGLIQGYDSPKPIPERPAAPTNRIPRGWHSDD